MIEKDLKYNQVYMETAKVFSKLSWAVRKKVGAVIVKNGTIISQGWNGTPTGFDNSCEITKNCTCFGGTDLDLRKCKKCNGSGKFKETKPEVIHAEMNAILKLAKSTMSSDGASLYVTLSPCLECSKLILQSGIKEIYYLEEYRDNSGLQFLEKSGIIVKQIDI